MCNGLLRAVRRSLGPSIGLSLLLGGLGMGFWYMVEEVDQDLCTIRTDGGGLVPLHDQFGPEVFCDPKWGMAGLGATYYAVMLLPAVLLVLSTVRFILSRRSCKEASNEP